MSVDPRPRTLSTAHAKPALKPESDDIYVLHGFWGLILRSGRW